MGLITHLLSFCLLLPFGNRRPHPDKYNPKLDIGDLVAVQMIVSGYKLSNGHVDINAKTKIKGKETYVFGYY